MYGPEYWTVDRKVEQKRSLVEIKMLRGMN